MVGPFIFKIIRKSFLREVDTPLDTDPDTTPLIYIWLPPSVLLDPLFCSSFLWIIYCPLKISHHILPLSLSHRSEQYLGRPLLHSFVDLHFRGRLAYCAQNCGWKNIGNWSHIWSKQLKKFYFLTDHPPLQNKTIFLSEKKETQSRTHFFHLQKWF